MGQGAAEFVRGLPAWRVAAAVVGVVFWVVAWRKYRDRQRQHPEADDPDKRLWLGLVWSLGVTIIGLALMLTRATPIWLQRALLVPVGVAALLVVGIGAAIGWRSGVGGG